jgi:uncharacterized membrane protein YbhN (UPF0104 family)
VSSSDVAPEPPPTSPRRRPGWKRAIELGFYALLLAFLAIYLRSINYTALSDVQLNWWALVVASVLALAFRYWGAFIWTTLLRSLGAHDVRLDSELLFVYAKSWLGRYIPGTAPWILGKIYFASEHGVPKSKLAVSSLLEAALQIIAQLLFALSILAFDARMEVVPAGLRTTFIIAIVALAVALIPPVFNRLLSWVFRIVRKRALPPEHWASWKTVSQGFVLYAIGSVVGGLSLFFIALTVYPELPYSEVLFVMGVSTLAGAASMLAVFAPGGIGVREGIQILLLSLIMPPEVALVVAVATRVHSVLVDLAFYSLATGQRFRFSRSPKADVP